MITFDDYVFYSSIIYTIIIIIFMVFTLITKDFDEVNDVFLSIAIIIISPILGMVISILIIPAIVILILYSISKLIYSYKSKNL